MGGMGVAFWVCAGVTVVSAAVSLGFSVATLPGSAARGDTSSMYASARSVALALTAVVAIFARSNSFLEAIALAMVIMQAVDAMIGVRLRDRFKTIGPAAISVANAIALIWLLQD